MDLNLFFNYNPYNPASTSGDGKPRLKGRTASFCTERSGQLYSDWDQGMSFFSADQWWLQPPGWVHKMINDAWQPLTAMAALSTATGSSSGGGGGSGGGGDSAGGGRSRGWVGNVPSVCNSSNPATAVMCNQSASAAYSGGEVNVTAVVRYANPTNHSVAVSVALPGGSGGWSPAALSQLAHADLDAANPANHTDYISPRDGAFVGGGFVAPPQSFSVAVFRRRGNGTTSPAPHA